MFSNASTCFLNPFLTLKKKNHNVQQNNKIISLGWNHRYTVPVNSKKVRKKVIHAEVHAILRAEEDIEGSTIFICESGGGKYETGEQFYTLVFFIFILIVVCFLTYKSSSTSLSKLQQRPNETGYKTSNLHRHNRRPRRMGVQ